MKINIINKLHDQWIQFVQRKNTNLLRMFGEPQIKIVLQLVFSHHTDFTGQFRSQLPETLFKLALPHAFVPVFFDILQYM